MYSSIIHHYDGFTSNARATLTLSRSRFSYWLKQMVLKVKITLVNFYIFWLPPHSANFTETPPVLIHSWFMYQVSCTCFLEEWSRDLGFLPAPYNLILMIKWVYYSYPQPHFLKLNFLLSSILKRLMWSFSKKIKRKERRRKFDSTGNETVCN